MKRLLFWAILMACVGGIAGYAFGQDHDPVVYRDVIVPAARIVEREVPGEVRFRDRIIYRYRTPEIVATAPGGAGLTVSTFCAPTVAVATQDTVYVPQTTELVRSVTVSSPWLPFRSSKLFVSTATSTGDLIGRDYRVPADFGVGTGDSLLVRSPRISPLAKEVARGLGYYLLFRAAEFGIRALVSGNGSAPWYQEGY